MVVRTGSPALTDNPAPTQHSGPTGPPAPTERRDARPSSRKRAATDVAAGSALPLSSSPWSWPWRPSPWSQCTGRGPVAPPPARPDGAAGALADQRAPRHRGVAPGPTWWWCRQGPATSCARSASHVVVSAPGLPDVAVAPDGTVFFDNAGLTTFDTGAGAAVTRSSPSPITGGPVTHVAAGFDPALSPDGYTARLRLVGPARRGAVSRRRRGPRHRPRCTAATSPTSAPWHPGPGNSIRGSANCRGRPTLAPSPSTSSTARPTSPPFGHWRSPPRPRRSPRPGRSPSPNPV